MRRTCLFLVVTLTVAGCGETTAPAPAPGGSATVDPPTLGEPAPAADEAMAAAASESVVTLSPENTTIQFVGIHTDPAKPDPRTGTFAGFSGTMSVDDATVKSIEVEIETGSLSTDIDKLTNHLKSADFFNVNEHPKATFRSTKIEPAADGTVTVTGELTLLGQTQPISFPATVSTQDGVTLKAEFSIDRTRFGMNFGTDNVAKEVAMTITVDG